MLGHDSDTLRQRVYCASSSPIFLFLASENGVHPLHLVRFGMLILSNFQNVEGAVPFA